MPYSSVHVFGECILTYDVVIFCGSIILTNEGGGATDAIANSYVQH